MRYLLAVLLFILPVVIPLHFASAKVSKFFRNVVLDESANTVENFILGRTCFSVSGSSTNLPCSPAHLADSSVQMLRFNIFADNEFSDVLKFAEELDKGNTKNLANRLLEHNRPVTHQISATSWYRNDWWAITLTPLQASVSSVSTNPSYPTVSTSLSRSEEISMRAGLIFAEENKLRFGGNLRLLSRSELREEFELYEVMSGAQEVKVTDNNVVYFEPAFSYLFNSTWHSEITATVTNVALYKKEKLSDSPTLEFGYVTVPDFLDGKFRSALHLTTREDLPKFADKILWGGHYQISDLINLSASLGSNQYGIGLTGFVDSVVYGLGYRAEEVYSPYDSPQNVKNILFEIGLQF